NYPQSNKKETTYYSYNTKNKIISATTYDKDSVAIAYKTFSYNSDGTLFSPSVKIVNGNIVKEGSVTYEFDNTVNPLYIIYSILYRILNSIYKNNISLTKYSENNFHKHTLKYINENYIIEEKISNMLIDSNDHFGNLYYLN